MNKKITDWLIAQNEFGENLILTEKESVLLDLLKKHDPSCQNCTKDGNSKTHLPKQQNPKQSKTTHFEEKLEKKSEANLNVCKNSSIESMYKKIDSEVLQKKPMVDLNPSAIGSTFLNSDITKKSQMLDPSIALSIAELKNRICNFDGCALKKIATNTVFGDGDPNSNVMFIGEAPGADEDKQGVPFVGRSGQLLNKMIESIGLKRENVYITNVVNWRPPGNRPPTIEEIDQCFPFLVQHIQLIAPKVLVLLGSTAMKAVLKTSSSLSMMRGIWHQYNAGNNVGQIETIVTFHPSYLLRIPSQKKLAWQDFLMLKSKLLQY
jgi:DNA polymerase